LNTPIASRAATPTPLPVARHPGARFEGRVIDRNLHEAQRAEGDGSGNTGDAELFGERSLLDEHEGERQR
jgi:hypothetical protein